MRQHDYSVDPNADRNQQLVQLFTSQSLYPQISQAVYDRHPRMEAPFHGDLMVRLAGLLPTYCGPNTDTDLLAWAEAQERTDPGIFLLCLHADCKPFVRSAIWKTIKHVEEPSRYDDDPELVQELVQDVWVWAIENLDELMIPGTAKLTTRLYEAAYYIALAWRKKQKTRRAAVIRKVYNLPSKAASERMARQLDEEAIERAAEERESAEIREEMEALAAY
jgi:hypothetical protein